MADKEYDSDDSQEVVDVKEETPVDEPQEDATLTNPDVVTKYQEAAKVVQAALVEVVSRLVVGARIVDVCKFGDELIQQRVSIIFNKKNKQGKPILKGISFPVCLSVNDVVCHCSPLESDETFATLAEGDLVKIDMGVHIDGFIAVVAHTVLVGNDGALSPEQVEQRNQVISATYTALEVAVKLMKPGNTNAMVTSAIKQVADAYNVRPISGTLMHQMKQFVIDGNKMILLKEEPEQKVDLCTFESGEVYAIDIAMSSGAGKPVETGARTTVYKRAVERKYALKNKSSRQFFNEVNRLYPTLPFSIRSFADEKAARLGIRECVNHELLLPYPVLNEKRGDFVAHAKVTVLLLPSGNTAQITGLAPLTYIQAAHKQQEKEGATPATDLDTKLSASLSVGLTLATSLQSEKNVSLPENIMELLSQAPVESKKKAKKNAKKAASASTVTAAATADEEAK